MTTAIVTPELVAEPLPVRHVDAENPWPGLWPFTEDSEPYFNGRARETAELARLVRRETLTVLHGQSGLGKSSLLMAGLFPLLRREEYLPLYVRLDHADGSAPFEEQIFTLLFRECERQGVEAPPRPAGCGLWEYLHGADATFWSRKNRVVTPLFAIDQFEELFTLGRTTRERERRSGRFESDLAELVDNRPPEALGARLTADPATVDAYDLEACRYKVVLSIREDYLAALDGMKRMMRLNLHNFLRLTPMDGEQALDAVRKTGGPLVDDDAADVIVRFLSKGPGGVEYEERRELREGEVDPALLSIVCYELNEKRRRLGRPRITADLLEDKNQREILSSFYERSFTGLDPRARVFVEERLLTDSGYRDSAAVDAAVRLPGVTTAAMDTLVVRRLLRTDVRSRVQRVELTHDVLTEVVKESRDKRRLEEQQEQSRRELLEREREAQRRASEARRVTRIVGASALLALALAAYAYTQKGVAERQRNEAERQRNEVIRQKASTDSARQRADSLRNAAVAMGKTIEAQNAGLQDTVTKMRVAQDSVRLTTRKALVDAELADRYLRMSGLIVTNRIADDSARRVAVQSVIDNATTIRNEAQQLTEGMNRQLQIFESAICDQLQRAAGKPDSAAIAPVRELREQIQARLKSDKFDPRLVCEKALNERGPARERP